MISLPCNTWSSQIPKERKQNGGFQEEREWSTEVQFGKMKKF